MITQFEPGSFSWLIAHEMRISLRALEVSKALRITALTLLVLYIIGGVAVAIWFFNKPIEAKPYYFIVAMVSALGILMLNLVKALTITQRTIYESGDLELLFTSPISSRRILMAKLTSISMSMLAYDAGFIFPLLLPIALLRQPALLSFVAVVIAISVYASCLGLGLALLIVRATGPRAARSVMQIIGAVFGGTVFLLSQLAPRAEQGKANGVARLYEWCLANGFGVDGFTSLPGRAAFGDPLALGIILGSAMALFGLTAWCLQNLFLRSFQSAGVKSSNKKAKYKNIARYFSDSLSFVILRKEALLLLRDPVLIFHMLLQLIFLTPMILGLGRLTNLYLVLPGAAFVSVFGAGKLVGDITELTVFGEDSPDLLAVSPHPAKAMIRWKLLAASIIGTPLMLIIPLLMISMSVVAATITLVFTLAAGMFAAAIELKLSKPVTRRKFSRRSPGSILSTVLTLLMAASLGGLCAYAVTLLS